MKNYDSRIKILENQYLTTKPDKNLIFYVINEEKEYWLNGELFIRPENITHLSFIEELKKKNNNANSSLIIATVKPNSKE